jgi:hypothetical protein
MECYRVGIMLIVSATVFIVSNHFSQKLANVVVMLKWHETTIVTISLYCLHRSMDGVALEHMRCNNQRNDNTTMYWVVVSSFVAESKSTSGRPLIVYLLMVTVSVSVKLAPD